MLDFRRFHDTVARDTVNDVRAIMTRQNGRTPPNRYNARLIFRRLGDFLCEWLATRVFLVRRLLRVDGMQGVDLFWIYFVGCGGTILEFLSRMEDF